MIHTIYFGPGASKTYLYIGAMKAIVEQQVIDTTSITTWGGVSAGSFFALLFLLGLTPSQVEAFFSALDMQTLLFCRESDDLGIVNSSQCYAFVEEVMLEYTGCQDMTFDELRRRTSKNLRVQVTNLTRREVVVLDADSAPEMSVVTAIVMSTAFPALFPPVRYRDDYYVDGGLIRTLIPSSDPDTLTIRVQSQVCEPPAVYDTVVDYLWDVFSCFMCLHNEANPTPASANHMCLYIMTRGFLISPDPAVQKEVIESGFGQCLEWIRLFHRLRGVSPSEEHHNKDRHTVDSGNAGGCPGVTDTCQSIEGNVGPLSLLPEHGDCPSPTDLLNCLNRSRGIGYETGRILHCSPETTSGDCVTSDGSFLAF